MRQTSASAMRLVSLALLGLSVICSVVQPLSFVSAASSSAQSSSSSSESVVTLTEENFDSLTSIGSWLLEFYAPWCGHCRTLAPVYEQAAQRLHGQLNLGKIDATVHRGLAKRFEIKGFPTLKFLRDGEVRSYNGGRSLDSFVEFARSMNEAPVTALKSVTELEKMRKEKNVVMMFVGGKGEEKRLFDTLAYRLQGLVAFISLDPSTSQAEPILKSLSLTKEAAASKPFVLWLTSHASTTDPSNRFQPTDEPWTLETLRSFILDHKLPLISKLEASTFDEVTTTGKRIAYIVIDPSQKDHTDVFIESLYALASQERLRDSFVFCSIDGVKYHRYISQFGVAVSDGSGGKSKDVSNLPTVVVLEPDMDYYYAPPPHRQSDGSLRAHPIGSLEAVEEFLESILDGRAGALLHGTIPWYNPSRYLKLLEKKLQTLPTWAVISLTVGLGIVVIGLMFVCCFYGMDSETLQKEEERYREEAEEFARRKAADKGGKNSSSSSSSTSSSQEGGGKEGLRSRKGKDQQ